MIIVIIFIQRILNQSSRRFEASTIFCYRVSQLVSELRAAFQNRPNNLILKSSSITLIRISGNQAWNVGLATGA